MIIGMTNEEMNMGDEHKIRWSGFSDQELTDLAGGMAVRCNYATDRASEERADALTKELRKEIDRRSRSYRGPGIYKSPEGESYEALGKVTVSGSDENYEHVVMRSNDRGDSSLWLEDLTNFDVESRYWTYVGPAGEGS
jgi:hypothetical protein